MLESASSRFHHLREHLNFVDNKQGMSRWGGMAYKALSRESGPHARTSSVSRRWVFGGKPRRWRGFVRLARVRCKPNACRARLLPFVPRARARRPPDAAPAAHHAGGGHGRVARGVPRAAVQDRLGPARAARHRPGTARLLRLARAALWAATQQQRLRLCSCARQTRPVFAFPPPLRRSRPLQLAALQVAKQQGDFLADLLSHNKVRGGCVHVGSAAVTALGSTGVSALGRDALGARTPPVPAPPVPEPAWRQLRSSAGLPAWRPQVTGDPGTTQIAPKYERFEYNHKVRGFRLALVRGRA